MIEENLLKINKMNNDKQGEDSSAKGLPAAGLKTQAINQSTTSIGVNNSTLGGTSENSQNPQAPLPAKSRLAKNILSILNDELPPIPVILNKDMPPNEDKNQKKKKKKKVADTMLSPRS
jgi:hypothetical protein